MQEAIKGGQIDVLTTLHQPSSPLNKEVAFYDAAYGCEGLRDALSLYYTKLVKSNLISMPKLIEMCVKNPSAALGQNLGEIKVGERVNAMLFNPNKKVITGEKLSLYSKEELYGKIEKIFN